MTGTRLLLLVFGFWLLMRSINRDATGRTLVDHLLGNTATKSPYLTASLPAATGAAGGGGVVNPFPGASGSRLDQGFDLTTRSILAPFAGTVVAADQTSSGWNGGGYLAIRSATNPNQVIYMAEGLSPTVQVGQQVSAGQSVGVPVLNPYNGVVGNIEAGWANPAQPLQPLAQVANQPINVAKSFYRWLLGLGGPQATSTTNAGYP